MDGMITFHCICAWNTREYRKKIKKSMEEKTNKLDHEGTIRMINQAWVTYIEMGTGIF